MAQNNELIISSFWEIYSHLTQKEKDDYKSFVLSGIFNKKEALKNMISALTQLEKENTSLQKDKLFAYTFSEKKYNKQVLHNYLVELKKLLIRFLQIQSIQNREVLQDWLLSESYLQKGLLSQFEKMFPHDRNEELFSSEDFFFRYRQKLLFDEYAATKAKKKNYHLLSMCMQDFTTNYFLETLRMYCELVNRKNLRMSDFDEEAMKNFLYYFTISHKKKQANPVLLIYYQVLLFLIDETNKKGERAYNTYKKYLKENLEHIPGKIAREICLFGQNFCVKNINANKHQYLNELFELYNLMLKYEVIYDGQYLTEWTFKNYITVALRLKAYEAAEQFIELYHHKLSPDVKFNAYHYNLAALYYEKNSFSKAMDELNKIHFSDTIYYLDARSILLKIYFTQGDFEALASLYHSVRVYLLRNKQLSRKLAERYKNIFLYTHKLALLILKKDFMKAKDFAEKHAQLGKKINQSSIANKPWLSKQFELAV